MNTTQNTPTNKILGVDYFIPSVCWARLAYLQSRSRNILLGRNPFKRYSNTVVLGVG